MVMVGSNPCTVFEADLARSQRPSVKMTKTEYDPGICNLSPESEFLKTMETFSDNGATSSSFNLILAVHCSQVFGSSVHPSS